MNPSQRIVLMLGAIAIAIITLCPPWIFVFQGGALKSERFAGYHPIWQANTPTDASSLAEIFSLHPNMVHEHRELFSIRIDSTRLTIQIVGVLLITFLVTAFLKQKSMQ